MMKEKNKDATDKEFQVLSYSSGVILQIDSCFKSTKFLKILVLN